MITYIQDIPTQYVGGVYQKLPPNSERGGNSATRSQWSRKGVTYQILLKVM